MSFPRPQIRRPGLDWLPIWVLLKRRKQKQLHKHKQLQLPHEQQKQKQIQQLQLHATEAATATGNGNYSYTPEAATHDQKQNTRTHADYTATPARLKTRHKPANYTRS